MKINVKYLDNLKVEASFDDFTIISDQPIRYKGDGTAPGPFDYFLASSAMCAAYFVKVYCLARNIPTTDILISQQNIIDPENRYKQNFHLEVQMPEYLSAKDQQGILSAVERCTVKRVIQNSPHFVITPKTILKSSLQFEYDIHERTKLIGKDLTLEESLSQLSSLIQSIGMNLEISSWRNPVPHVWSVHLRDADCPMNFTNGKGRDQKSALCSALGEFLERLTTNYFYSDFYLGQNISNASFVHYPDEKWFPLSPSQEIPAGLMDDHLLSHYSFNGDLKDFHLLDTNSGNKKRGICAVPFIRQSDQEKVYIPVNLIANLFVSNGMSAGNSLFEARVQALSEIFERAIKNKIIREEITLPDVPQEILALYPHIHQGITQLKKKGFVVMVKDASLGGKFPLMCVAIKNPKTCGAYASFGAHPKFEVALERSLTELLQGRSFEGLNEMPPPTFNEALIKDDNNLIDHFIDSTGVLSWKFFSRKENYPFVHWNFKGTTEEEFKTLLQMAQDLGKEVYIADYDHLGTSCRILIPNFSEIYPPEELIWNNHNESLKFRSKILNLHQLKDSEKKDLLELLHQSEHDDFYLISELIGITFEEATTWGDLVIGELKFLLFLSLGHLEKAMEMTEILLAFDHHQESRKKFFRLMAQMIHIKTDASLKIEDFENALTQVYGEHLFKEAKNALEQKTSFFGLHEVGDELKSLKKHQKLIESYHKIHQRRLMHSQNML